MLCPDFIFLLLLEIHSCIHSFQATFMNGLRHSVLALCEVGQGKDIRNGALTGAWKAHTWSEHSLWWTQHDCVSLAQCWGSVSFLAPPSCLAIVPRWQYFHLLFHPCIFALTSISSFSPSLLWVSGELTLVGWVSKASGLDGSVQPRRSSGRR